jgi:hypothetical protein
MARRAPTGLLELAALQAVAVAVVRPAVVSLAAAMAVQAVAASQVAQVVLPHLQMAAPAWVMAPAVEVDSMAWEDLVVMEPTALI